MKELIANFWVNEQDPYEPTGIVFEVNGELDDLANWLQNAFAVKHWDEENKTTTGTKLKITVVKVDE